MNLILNVYLKETNEAIFSKELSNKHESIGRA